MDTKHCYSVIFKNLNVLNSTLKEFDWQVKVKEIHEDKFWGGYMVYLEGTVDNLTKIIQKVESINTAKEVY